MTTGKGSDGQKRWDGEEMRVGKAVFYRDRKNPNDGVEKIEKENGRGRSGLNESGSDVTCGILMEKNEM